jgi:hypothetical protein
MGYKIRRYINIVAGGLFQFGYIADYFIKIAPGLERFNRLPSAPI